MTRLAEPISAGTSPAAGGRAATILIVDDEDQNRRLLEVQLKPEGYVTESAAGGEEALASIARHPPDLILLDVMMPGMSGYEVARTLKANPATSSIPIIMVTAYADRDARLAGLNAGAEDFLAKPVDRAELWLRVRNLLRLKTLSDLLQNQSSILECRVAERTAELESANDSLRESEARFRSLTEMASDFYWESDAEHRLETRGAAHRKPSTVAEFQRGEQIGKCRWELPYLSPDEAGWQAHRAVLDAHLPARNFEFSRRGADGSERHISISGDPVFDAAGRFKGYRGVGADITERKRSRQAERAAAIYARGLIEASLDPLVTISVEGKITDANRMTEVDTGIARTALIGTDFVDYFTEPERARAGYLKVLEHGYVRDYPLSMRHCDGHTTEVLYNAAVYYDETGKGRGVFAAARDVTALKAAEANLRRYAEQLKTAFMSAVEVATTISEMRDPYTAGHERRVAEIAVAIGAALGFDERGQEGLRVAGHLHDVGKMTIPAEILSKPGKLSRLEFELVKGHARASYDVLKGVAFPWQVAEVALQHHERIDGSGYPQGLKGDAILLEARIMAVADVVEAMSSHRPYRPGLGTDKALAEIERGRGTAYDTMVADACLKLFREAGYTLPK